MKKSLSPEEVKKFLKECGISFHEQFPYPSKITIYLSNPRYPSEDPVHITNEVKFDLDYESFENVGAVLNKIFRDTFYTGFRQGEQNIRSKFKGLMNI